MLLRVSLALPDLAQPRRDPFEGPTVPDTPPISRSGPAAIEGPEAVLSSPTAEPESRTRSGLARSLLLPGVGLALICAVAAADFAGGKNRAVIGLVLLAPFLVALDARYRSTLLLAFVGLAVACSSAIWNGNADDWGYWMRTGFVAVGGVVACLTARARRAEVESRHLLEERAAVADMLEAGLRPVEPPQIEGWRIETLYQPAAGPGRVGGDFYDAYRVGREWMVVVGDVVGHGSRAAAATALVRFTLRTAATLTGSASRAFATLNRDLLARTSLSPCASAYALLSEDPTCNTVEVACAGIPRPFLVRDGKATEVGRYHTLLGVSATAFPSEPARISVACGDVLVLYTDGVTERRGADERFGSERVEHALTEAEGAQDAVARILAALTEFGAGVQDDDIVIVALEHTSVAPRVAPPRLRGLPNRESLTTAPTAPGSRQAPTVAGTP
jgi:serine phosphatase RsbU (regulator of sigma subunit)